MIKEIATASMQIKNGQERNEAQTIQRLKPIVCGHEKAPLFTNSYAAQQLVFQSLNSLLDSEAEQ